jgi:hypothetical protein
LSLEIDAKELNQFLKTCRKHGVLEISVGNIHVKMTEAKSEPLQYENSDKMIPELREITMEDFANGVI